MKLVPKDRRETSNNKTQVRTEQSRAALTHIHEAVWSAWAWERPFPPTTEEEHKRSSKQQNADLQPGRQKLELQHIKEAWGTFYVSGWALRD